MDWEPNVFRRWSISTFVRNYNPNSTGNSQGTSQQNVNMMDTPANTNNNPIPFGMPHTQQKKIANEASNSTTTTQPEQSLFSNVYYHPESSVSVSSLFPIDITTPSLNDWSTNTFNASSATAIACQSFGKVPLGNVDDEVPNNFDPNSSTNPLANIHNTSLNMAYNDGKHTNASTTNTNNKDVSQLMDVEKESMNINNNNDLLSIIDDSNLSDTSTYQYPESSVSVPCFFPISDSVTLQPYNRHFNSSTNTFIFPMLDSINDSSLPIQHDGEHFNDSFENTKNNSSSLIPDESIPSNTTDNIPSVVCQQQQDKRHALTKKKKKVKTFICSFCQKKCNGIGVLNAHLKTHDPNRARPYQCNICDKSFTEKSILKTHVKRHNKETIFKCDHCNKCFTTKFELKQHQPIHTRKKPYKCPFCDKRFPTKIILECHIRTHTGERPFKCDFCNKRFKAKHNKTRHHRIHTEEKPFKCHICHKGLSSKVVFEEHLNKHLNKNPYKCGQCPKAYATKSGLRYHLKTHNRLKTYTCHYCGTTFEKRGEYKNHIRYEEATDEDRKCHLCKKAYSDRYNLKKHNKKYHSEI